MFYELLYESLYSGETNKWRQFSFFESTPIRDPTSPGEEPLFSDPQLSAVTPGIATVFIANSGGYIKEFTKDLLLKDIFKAYDSDYSILHLKYLVGTSLLLSVGTKQGSPTLVHLWDLEKRDKKTDEPHCHSTVTVNNGTTNTFPLSAFAISKDYSVMAFGFAEGTVILVRGDIIHDRGARQRHIYTSSGPITGLSFYSTPDDNNPPVLFATSVNQVITLPTTGRNSGEPETVLEKSKGAALGCVSQTDLGELVIARDEGIQYYTTKQRGVSFVLETSKKMLTTYGRFLVIISNIAAASSLTSSLIDSGSTRIFIIDTLNKLIAYSGQIPLGVKHMFVQWSRINIISSDGTLYAVQEKDLAQRLDILKQRNLYDIALSMLNNLNISDSRVDHLHRDYGDFLYNEGDPDGALAHYISSIDLGETSQIILKYRDPQYINNLTLYLEALHEKGLAKKEHTTLLLNSYAKLKDMDKLRTFVSQNGYGSEDANFDYDTAIKICRQAGYNTLAAYLAQRVGDSDLTVQIKLRDLEDYGGTLSYIKSLNVADALRNLIQHSRQLLKVLPVDTTALLISIFTGRFVPVHQEITISPPKAEPDVASALAAPVLHSYRAFVNYLANRGGEEPSQDAESDSKSSHSGNSTIPPGPTYQPPRPRLIFSSFVDHPYEFVIFLEACIERYHEFGADDKSKMDLISTLFEMYLTLGTKATNEEDRKHWEAKAKELGTSAKGKVDQNTILLISQLMSYTDGEILAQEDTDGFQIDLFRSRVAAKDVKGAIDVLHKYGEQETELYCLALSFFISSEEIFNQAGNDEFQTVLEKISDHKLMAPLQIIQILSSNSVTKVGHVREYLIKLVTNERAEIERNNKLAESYRKESQTKKQEIDKLLTEARVVQYSECSSCGQTLDLPAVHFACKHSYHQRCLNNFGVDVSADGFDAQCPKCLGELQGIKAIRKAQEDLADRNELFFSSLKEGDNKFKVLTDFFGRGALTSSYI